MKTNFINPSNLIIFILILLFTYEDTKSQSLPISYDCEIIPPSFQILSHGDCNTVNGCDVNDTEVEKYIPTSGTAIKTIRLRFILIHYSETEPKNFVKSNQDHIDLFQDFIDGLNNRFANLVSTNEQDCNYESDLNCTNAGTLNIPTDTRIQFSLDEEDIVEVVDPNRWNADNYSSCGAALFDMHSNITIGENNAINVYFQGSECLFENFSI